MSNPELSPSFALNIEQTPPPQQEAIAALPLAEGGLQWQSPAEFSIGPTQYSYQGKNELGMHFTGMAPTGEVTPFVVYISNSGGSYRASQGLESYTRSNGQPAQRYLKGAEQSYNAQYTQDTQLHPLFDRAVGLVEENRQVRDMLKAPEPPMDAQAAAAATKSFEAQTTVYELGNAELNAKLHEIKAGYLSSENVKDLTGIDPTGNQMAAWAALRPRIEALNASLEASGTVPDFSQLSNAKTLTQHPQLGNIITEVYRKTVAGTTYEWHMSRTEKGNQAWIERIRFADAEASSYGTDKQVVYSGILTSKPVEYNDQCNGLPKYMRSDMGNGYNDITTFLKQLAPVNQYLNYRDKSEDAGNIFAAVA